MKLGTDYKKCQLIDNDAVTIKNDQDIYKPERDELIKKWSTDD